MIRNTEQRLIGSETSLLTDVILPSLKARDELDGSFISLGSSASLDTGRGSEEQNSRSLDHFAEIKNIQ